MPRKPSRQAVADTLLQKYDKTHAELAGVRIGSGSSQQLYGLLCASTLMSTRISADLAVRGTKALLKAGWKTPEKVAGSTWAQRAKVLNESGYARYD